MPLPVSYSNYYTCGVLVQDLDRASNNIGYSIMVKNRFETYSTLFQFHCLFGT